MIVLDYIQALKKNVKSETNTFLELVNEAKKKEFERKEEIITHFESINIKEKNDFVHLKYSNQKMFKQPWDSFYLLTRGLILDWKKEKVVCFPFEKFFELDEHKSSTLKVVKEKMNSGIHREVTEKIDGSLIIARNYESKLIVASSGSLEGPHVEIAKNLLKKDKELTRFIQQHPNHTIILEMKNTSIPQLIKYGEDVLTVIGIRDMGSYHLLHRFEIEELAKGYNVSLVPKVEITVEEMLKEMESPNISNHEGYILRIDELLVKMKTKNFIMANRFAGEPTRNFNMVIEAVKEGRTEAIRPMIKGDFLESYDLTVDVIQRYVNEKEKKILSMYEKVKHLEEMSDFVKESQKLFPKDVKNLVALKKEIYQRLGKEDIKFLKKFQDYFTCVSHFKYAELNEMPLEEVEKKLENGEIQYLKKFKDDYSGKTIYIIHKWQWLNRNEIMYQN